MKLACFLKCQFVIGGHSLFLLDFLEGGIYELEAVGMLKRHWTDMKNSS